VHAADADLILHDGKVVTVDERLSIHEAWPCGAGRIVKWASVELLKDRGRVLSGDLHGRLVLPGLMDSHAHPADACLTELDHPIRQWNECRRCWIYPARARILQGR